MTKFLKKTRLFDDILVDQQEDENELDGMMGSAKNYQCIIVLIYFDTE